MSLVRPTLLVSRCLTGAACRWDGVRLACESVAGLDRIADVIAPCPEMDIGLGVPRPPLRIVKSCGARRLLQPATGADLTDVMRSWTADFFASLPPVDGLIFKARSPSCGAVDARIFADEQADDPIALGAGLFAAGARRRYAGAPAIDEVRLADPVAREHFLAAVFTLAEYRRASRAADDPTI